MPKMEAEAIVFFVGFLAIVSAKLNVTRDDTWPTDVAAGFFKQPLRCRIRSDPNAFNVTWTKDSVRISKDNVHFSVETDSSSSTLIINNPVVADEGTYTCLVVNGDGERANSSGYITVTSTEGIRPRIIGTTLPEDGVYYGDNVNLSCIITNGEVDWHLGLGYGWYRDGVKVNDTPKHAWEPSDVGVDLHLGLSIFNVTEEDLGNYTCKANNQYGSDEKILTLELQDKKKAPMPTLVIILASVGGFICLATIITIATCARMKKKEPGLEDLPWMNTDNYECPNHPLEYDVFISYSSCDRPWVRDVLMKNLEKEGYRVCIDFKCFMPGMQVVDNIMEAIYKSRRTVVVMSKNFLKSVWGPFELEHVQHRLITMKDDSLLLVKYDGCQIPRKLMGKTFLDWNDNSVKPHFWERLFKTLGPDKVQYKEDKISILGLDPDRPTDFEQALLETEILRVKRSIRCLGDEDPLLEDSDDLSQEEDPLFHSGSSGFCSYGSAEDNQAPDEIIGAYIV